MRVICAPNSFKESLSAQDAAEAMARGVRRAQPDAEVDLCPIADGGDGTVEAMLAATHGTRRVTAVAGPRGQRAEAAWGLLGRQADQPLTAVIEMAKASGLAILPPAQRDPTLTSTYGTGQLILAALDAGAQRITLGIGGSATTDGGCGAAQALGARFYDAAGRQIEQPISGGLLPSIRRIDITALDPRLRRTQIVVACDVTNPMTGPDGAAAVYGPQKGATPAQVRELDQALRHLAELFRRDPGCDVERVPGSGAAGAMGGGMLAMLGAQLQPGIEMVLAALNFRQRVAGSNLCLTGEGRLDGQSVAGKAVIGLAQQAAEQGVPTVALVGCLGPDVERTLDAGLAAYYVIGAGLPAEESIRRAAELLEAAAARVVRGE